jgi:hypothetical protein
MQKLFKFLFNNYLLSVIFLSVIGFNIWMYFGIGGIRDIRFVSGGVGIPDTQLYQSVDNLNDTLLRYGSQGKLYYLRYQFRDFIYPFFYGLLLMGILYRLIKPRSFNIWMYIPFLAVLFDLIENYYLRICFYDYPNLIANKVMIASAATSLKWIFVAFSFVLIIIAYIHRRKKYIAKSKKNNQNANTYTK